MAEELRRRLCALLMPEGKLLGEPGRRPDRLRRIQGGVEEAEALFAELKQLGHDAYIPDYPGERVRVGEFGTAGYREVSKSGEPTIDIRFTIKSLRQ